MNEALAAAYSLALSTWRLEFESSPELQKSAFERESLSLLASCREIITSHLSGFLHPNHRANLDEKNYYLFLAAVGSSEPLARVLIQSPGVRLIHLKVFSYGEERVEEYKLFRTGKDEYKWLGESGVLMKSSELGSLCLAALFNAAAKVVDAHLEGMEKVPASS